MNNKTFTIYTISYMGRPIYVGKTTLGNHRWVCHKTKARQSENPHSRWIHRFMAENTCDPECFPEYDFEVVAETTDEAAADLLESFFAEMFAVPLKHTRPIVPTDMETR